jgi:hypothetical protein
MSTVLMLSTKKFQKLGVCFLLLSLLACTGDNNDKGSVLEPDIILPNGDQYQGEFKSGQFHGQGKLVFVRGGFYEGEFTQGRMTGKGTLVDSDDTRYDGLLVNGEYEGQGKIIYSSKAAYEGGFSQGQYHGQGKYTDKDTWYEGQFDEGDFAGKGEYVDYQGDHFKGEVKSWVANGKGELTTADKVVMKGDFENGRIQKGEKTNAEGDHYKGSFQYGEYDGEGVLTFADGGGYAGEFSYGRYHGEGTLRTKDKDTGEVKVQEGRWSNNTLIFDELTGEHFHSQAELALERHQMLLNSHLLNLKESDSSSANIYFLGIGGDGTQSVFRREIEKAADVVNQRYGTSDRSISLINHHDSATKYPLATRRSIASAINGISQKMNVQDDILFMVLSSHGSKEFSLSLKHDSINLPDLNAGDLSTALSKANIKWKVILISACYSGGFIDDLADDHTLIMTAADSENTSFGCSEESKMTYFGKALFNEVLAKDKNISLSEAFRKAKKLIVKWEEDEELTASNPMLSAPSAIVKKLAGLKR